jgi:uncharacterized integral membrane protein (TIGR00698 family)
VNPTILFFCGVVLAASGLVSAPVALVAGVAFGLTQVHPLANQSSRVAKFLLQASVVLLGFGMNLGEVLRVGRSGFAYSAVSIVAALAMGLALGKLLHVKPKASLLIACGTAICGGSAIAAVGPVADAGEDEMAVSLGTVFTLNAVALLLFPMIGWALHMSQSQFGLWCALAIHDTSSVVGASARFGAKALEIGTTVKLVRALWIVPVTLVVAGLSRRLFAAREGETEHKTKISLPWFIGLFVLAAVLRFYAPAGWTPVWLKLSGLGKTSLTVVLFLIGSSLSWPMLRRVGWRPMLQGVALWVLVAGLSLWAIHSGWIAV